MCMDMVVRNRRTWMLRINEAMNAPIGNAAAQHTNVAQTELRRSARVAARTAQPPTATKAPVRRSNRKKNSHQEV